MLFHLNTWTSLFLLNPYSTGGKPYQLQWAHAPSCSARTSWLWKLLPLLLPGKWKNSISNSIAFNVFKVRFKYIQLLHPNQSLLDIVDGICEVKLNIPSEWYLIRCSGIVSWQKARKVHQSHLIQISQPYFLQLFVFSSKKGIKKTKKQNTEQFSPLLHSASWFLVSKFTLYYFSSCIQYSTLS